MSIKQRIALWLANGETGLSSKTIAFYLGFGIIPKRASHPEDVDDNETIKKYLKRLSNNTLSVLIRDIESELPYDMPLGLLWRDLLYTLRGESDKRKEQ